MSKSDIYKDYELTNFSYFNTPCSKSQLNDMFATIEAQTGETLEDKFRMYLRTYFAIGNSAIDAFRDKMLGYDIDDGIQSIDNRQQTTDDSQSVYDLSGRKIAHGQLSMANGQLKKGIYIVNGKKVVW